MGCSSWGCKESDRTEQLHFIFISLYSCLKNPMDRGAWRAIVHGVTESEMAERLTCALLHMDTQFKFCILNTGTSQVVSG